MKVLDIKKNYDRIKHGHETHNYAKKRIPELKQKGYSDRQVQDAIQFELGLKYVISTSAKKVTKNACIAGGIEAGSIVGTAISPGFGTFAGGAVGSKVGPWACEKTIDTLTEKGVQKISESLYTTSKDPGNQEIDLTKVEAYIENARNSKNPAQYFETHKFNGKPTGYATNPYTAQEIGRMSPKEFKENHDKIMEQMEKGQIKREAKDYSGYEGKVFSREDIAAMSTKEYADAEGDILAQMSAIGIPLLAELEESVKSGGMIYVQPYTRADGTQVRGYYRAHPH